VALWGRPSRPFRLIVRPRSAITASLRSGRLRQHARLEIAGRIVPARGSAGRLVQLQWRDGAKWRPIVNTRANRLGRYRLRYRFARRGGYSVQMRVTAIGSPGRPTLRSPARTIEVLPY
jgi:hypothetical protein